MLKVLPYITQRSDTMTHTGTEYMSQDMLDLLKSILYGTWAHHALCVCDDVRLQAALRYSSSIKGTCQSMLDRQNQNFQKCISAIPLLVY